MGYDRILVPLDGSHLAEYILPHVETVVEAFSSELILLHVVSGRESDPAKLTQSQRAARADIAKYLEHLAEVLGEKQIEAEWHVCFGDPAREIIRQAADSGVDLVMMSTHGSGGRAQEGMGSVAMAVVSSGRTPVMLVKPPDEVAAR